METSPLICSTNQLIGFQYNKDICHEKVKCLRQIEVAKNNIKDETLHVSIRTHCQKNVQIRSFFQSEFSRIRTRIRRDTPYLTVFSPNAGKYGPEKTPYLDIFRAVMIIFIKLAITFNPRCFQCILLTISWRLFT